ncbi:MAG: sulfotransferase, partial [Rhodobacteraceae bacterium]|nr:sulfotransferase [Paracoccaceae bacterium]
SDFKNLGIVYREFDKMARHWSECLPDRVREVSYEEVIADPEGQLRAVLDFVGLDWTPEVLDFKASFSQVNTASLSQVRQPIYSDAVARWRRYGPMLKDLAAELPEFLTDEEMQACGAFPLTQERVAQDAR